MARNFLELNAKERNICLEIDARIYTNLILLRFMISFIAFWLWFRFSQTQFNQLTQSFSVGLSIVAIVFNILDLQLMKCISKPDKYIWLSVIIKTLKSSFTAIMFMSNNTANDFTIGLCFLITSWLGWWYFHNNRVNRPKDTNHDLSLCENNTSKIICMDQKIKILCASKYQGNSYRWLAGFSLFFFLFMVFMANF